MAGTELLRRSPKIARLYVDQYVILPDRSVRPPIDEQDWSFWRMWDEVLGLRQVELTEFPGGVTVSTVFLGMDHDFGSRWKWEAGEDGWPVPVFPVGYRPLLWETMVFGGPLGDYQRRYRSERDARRGHKNIARHVAHALGLARDALTRSLTRKERG